MADKIIDISVKLEPKMFTFPGNTPFTAKGPYSAVSGKYREFCYELTMTTQTGTHIQGPHYFLSDGKTIDSYPLDYFEGEIILIDVEGVSRIDDELLHSRIGNKAIDSGKVIILKTGFMDKVIKTIQEDQEPKIDKIMQQKPGVSLSGAKFIAGLAPKMLGIDSFGFEIPGSVDFEVNHYFCQQNILLLEGLVNLNNEMTGAWLEAFPLPIPGVEGTPCRAIVKMPSRIPTRKNFW